MSHQGRLRPVEGFHHAAATRQERADKHVSLMLVCEECGKRIVPSGLGVGSHRRKHARERSESTR